MAVTVEQVAEAMVAMVARDAGQKKYKPGDLTKAMIERFGADCSKDLCKQAIRVCVESGKLVYTYFGGSYLEVPHKEGAAPDK